MRVTIKMMSAASQWNGVDQVRIDRDEEWTEKKLRPNLVESMLSAGNARIWKYKMQFQYCPKKKIQYKNWKTHNTFHVAGFFESKYVTQCTEV